MMYTTDPKPIPERTSYVIHVRLPSQVHNAVVKLARLGDRALSRQYLLLVCEALEARGELEPGQ